MRAFTFIAFSLIFFHASHAQWSREDWAKKLTERLAYEDAEDIWSDLAESEYVSWDKKLSFAREAADCAMRINHMNTALEWSKLIIQYGDLNVTDVLRHAKLLRINGRHADVNKVLVEAADEYPNDETIERAIAHDALVLALLEDASEFEVNRYRPHAVTSEYAAFPYGTGLIYMSSGVQPDFLSMLDAWTGKDFTNLCHIEDVLVGQPELSFMDRLKGAKTFEDLGRTRTHDGPVAFDEDETRAVLTRNSPSLDSTGNVMVSRLKLELFQLEDGQWVPMAEFPWNSSEHSHGHGAFDANGNLVFTSDRPGGFGGTDLYRCQWDESKAEWSNPINLGPTINSEGNELFPYIGTSGNLYFSSDGWPGVGGLDVFYQFDGDEELHRFGSPVNSNQDDFGFFLDDLSGNGWLSSNREDNQDAIFQVEGPPMMNEVLVSVVSCDGTPLANKKVSIRRERSENVQRFETDERGQISCYGVVGFNYTAHLEPFPGMDSPPSVEYRVENGDNQVVVDLNTATFENRIVVVDESNAPLGNVLLAFDHAAGRGIRDVTDENGVFRWSSDGEEFNAVKMDATLINYDDASLNFDAAPPGCRSSIDQTLVLYQEAATEERIDLDLILYDLGSSRLRESSKVELDKLVAYLKEKSEIRVELSSHTDCRDDKESNQRLSQLRAESCVKYIISKGISADRIIARGYGETQLVNECSDAQTCGCVPPNQEVCIPCSEAQHQQNRRTELRLLAD
jgi:outer membrane protein OmpA-like peptidoglycan-associated protein